MTSLLAMVVGSFTIVIVIEVKVPSHLRSRAGTYLIDYPKGHLHYAIMPKYGLGCRLVIIGCVIIIGDRGNKKP